MDDEEIFCPPTTHLVATVDDLTDMLDFDSEYIDGMDDDTTRKRAIDGIDTNGAPDMWCIITIY